MASSEVEELAIHVANSIMASSYERTVMKITEVLIAAEQRGYERGRQEVQADKERLDWLELKASSVMIYKRDDGYAVDEDLFSGHKIQEGKTLRQAIDKAREKEAK